MYPTECPIAGQVRKICAIPENCTRTCNNLKETITCQETCTPYGCECPNGMVVNRITKECIKPEKCPLDEGNFYYNHFSGKKYMHAVHLNVISYVLFHM